MNNLKVVPAKKMWRTGLILLAALALSEFIWFQQRSMFLTFLDRVPTVVKLLLLQVKSQIVLKVGF